MSFISKRAQDILQLKMVKTNVEISGIGKAKQKCRAAVQVQARSTHQNFEFEFEALLIKKIASGSSGASNVSLDESVLDGKQMADPEFSTKREIDILLGVAEIAQIASGGLLRLNKYLIALDTKLGFIVCGATNGYSNPSEVLRALVVNVRDNNFGSQIKKFWEMPEGQRSTTKETKINAARRFSSSRWFGWRMAVIR